MQQTRQRTAEYADHVCTLITVTLPRRPHVRATLREGRRDWYRITNNASAGSADIWIYDEVGWFGVTAADFVRDLQALGVSSISLHINSPGGEVFDGLAIHTALRNHPAKVTVHVDGLAASIASVIACAGDRVVMARNATMMIHDASGLCVGNASDMRELADLLDKCSDNIASVYSERAGGEISDWRSAMARETWYSAQEAVDAGLADEVATPRERQLDTAPDVPENTWDLSIFRYAGRDSAPAPAPVDRGPAGRGVEPAPVDRPKATGGVVAPGLLGVGERGCTLMTAPATTSASGTAVSVEVTGAEEAGQAIADAIRAGQVTLSLKTGEVDITDHLAGPVVVDQGRAASPDDTDPADPDSGDGDQPAEEDDWAATVTALITDAWTALAAHLIDPAAPDQGDPLARLREACIE